MINFFTVNLLTLLYRDVMSLSRLRRSIHVPQGYGSRSVVYAVE